MSEVLGHQPDVSTHFLEATGVTKRLGVHLVLHKANLAIRRGETLVLLGRSGEGKSVFLKNLAGLMEPDEGSIKVEGQEIVGLDERHVGVTRRKFGILFQGGALFDSFNVEQNVAFPLVEAGIRDREEIRQRVSDSLDAVGMQGHLLKMPIQLSGGERKRVALARAIIAKPPCLLYDEPTAGLDPIATANIDRLIRRFQKQFRITSFVITHDLKSVERIADRVAFLRAGSIQLLGTPRDMFASTDPAVQNFLEGRTDDLHFG